MTITIKDQRTGGKALEYTENFWTGRRSLKYDGKELRRDNNKKFVSDDDNITFDIKGNKFTGISVSWPLFAEPAVLAEKQPIYIFILSVLVFVPGIVFGAIGGAVGGVLGYVNLLMMTQIKTPWLKVVISVEMIIISAAISFGFAWLVGGWFL